MLFILTVDANIKQLRRLVAKFNTTNPTFANAFRRAAARQRPIPHHSGFAGLITNADGQPIPGATATITGTKKSATSGLDGHYQLIKMHPNNYEITFSAPGLPSKTIIFYVSRGKIATLNITL